ncbi:MAG: hypothetical protein ACLRUZ_04555 [Faecalimonas sp.]
MLKAEAREQCEFICWKGGHLAMAKKGLAKSGVASAVAAGSRRRYFM